MRARVVRRLSVGSGVTVSRTWAFATLLGVALGFERGGAQASASLQELLAFRRCPLAAELRAVYERPLSPEAGRQFVAVRVKSVPHSYVRCRTGDRNDPQLYCEASSLPFVAPPAGDPQAAARAALAKLGFATESVDKDFPYRRPLGGSPDFDAIATFMLTALHEAYGVGESTPLVVDAPFAGPFVSMCKY